MKDQSTPHPPLDVVVLRLQSLLATVVVTPFSVWRWAQGQEDLALVGLSAVGGLLVLAWLTFQPALFKKISRWLMPLVVAGQFAAISGMVLLAGHETKLWVYPVLVSAFLLLRTHEATAITLTASGLLTALVHQQGAGLRETAIFMATCLLTLVFTHIFASRLHRDNQMFRDRSLRDPLTGLGNRRQLDDMLNELSAQTSATHWSLVIFDIDHFKSINDRFGHHVGDACLQRVAHAMQSQLGPDDKLYRFGGEEFVLLSPTPGPQALKLAQRVRQHIETTPLIRQTPVTLSAGVASRLKDQSVRHWLARADHALYEAKESGRNRVLMAPDDLPLTH